MRTLQACLLCLAAFLVAGCGDDDGGQNQNGNQNNNNQPAGECGDGVQQAGEECDDGAQNSDTVADACRTNCRTAFCGDGVVDASELCDDGPANSDDVPDACRTDCGPPRCGDGVVDVQAGESCDDGNDVAGDGCSPTCVVEYCGNGVIDPGEVCDDGNWVGGDGCSPACNSLEICGDGVVDVTADPPEQCDDGNHRSHDGCASGCVAEFPSWVLHPGSLGGIRGLGMVYDSLRERLVVFGGDGFCGPFCDRTFEYDGRRWKQVLTATTPPPRSKVAMAYDSVRHVVVLFGGEQASILDDTWEYDGTDWQPVTTPHRPPPRAAAQLVYDSARQVMVLFGGHNAGSGNGQLLGDTWEFDGTDWTERTPTSPAPSPSPRHEFAMAYDPDRHVTVLQGGGVDLVISDETWEWDGTAWTLRSSGLGLEATNHQLAYDSVRQVMVLVGGDCVGFACDPANTETLELRLVPYGWVATGHHMPGRRNGAGLAFDGLEGRVVLFGGSDEASQHTDDTWAYDGSAWADITPATVPTPRARGALAYDSLRGAVVMFGGGGENMAASDLAPAITWRFEREGWLGENLPGSPPPLSGHAMAYDPQRDCVVLFGGATDSFEGNNPGVLSDQTFELHGAVWQEVPTSNAPSPRTHHRLVFDAGLGLVLLFGGVAGTNPTHPAFGDTWAFDGTDWTELAMAQAPPARSHHMMTYDEARQETVLYGGISAQITGLSDTWAFDGTTWTELQPAEEPPFRALAAMAFDPLRQRVVLYGGLHLAGYHDDVWEWDGVDWTRVYSLPPAARGYMELAYHRGLKQMVLFGGYQGTTPLGDTWLYRYASQWPDEICHNGVDDDGDGDVDCADPDCDDQPCGGNGVCEAGFCVTP